MSGEFSIQLTKKEKNYVLKKLKELESEETKKEQEKAAESKVKNEANKIWEQISDKIRRESANGNRPEVEYWISVRDKLFGEQEGEMRKDLRISKDIKSKVKKMLDDEIYYQDVKHYTHDFTFLRDLPEVALGHTPRRGFYDTGSLFRYDDLRVNLQITWDEYRRINELLSSQTDDATIRVLQARKTVIEKLREKRRKEGREI